MTAGCLVAGCTGGGGPAPSPPVETSAEPSETETPEPEPTTTGPPKPERPAAMERDDAEGAAAAAEYFLSLYGYVLATGDTAEWDAMTWAETCEFCASVREDAIEIAESGDRFSGSEILISNVEVAELDSFTGAYPVLASYEQNPYQRLDGTGDVVDQGSGGRGELQIDVLHTGTGWATAALTLKD
ncbi:DUF6318 family protein [Cellulosimicrobium funkei]